MTVSTAPTLAYLRTAPRRLCAPVEVERDIDRSMPAFGLLVARHGLTLTLGCRVYRVRRLRHLPPAPLRLVNHWPPNVRPEAVDLRLVLRSVGPDVP